MEAGSGAAGSARYGIGEQTKTLHTKNDKHATRHCPVQVVLHRIGRAGMADRRLDSDGGLQVKVDPHAAFAVLPANHGALGDLKWCQLWRRVAVVVKAAAGAASGRGPGVLRRHRQSCCREWARLQRSNREAFLGQTATACQTPRASVEHVANFAVSARALRGLCFGIPFFFSR